MAFKLDKGSKFVVDKGITQVRIGLGWDTSKIATPVDVDAHAFGCIHLSNGMPSFYNDASHALTYANDVLIKTPDKSFKTSDGSMIHSGDNLTGLGDGDDETIRIHLDKLPEPIDNILVFVTIHDAKKRNQHFGLVESSYIALYNDSNGEELCKYNLKNEFGGMINIQVGSFLKTDGKWTFTAVGAGSTEEDLGDIIGKLM